MKKLLLISILVCITSLFMISAAFAEIDTRLACGSHTAGELVFDVQIMSDIGGEWTDYHQHSITVDAELSAQSTGISYSNRLYDLVDGETP